MVEKISYRQAVMADIPLLAAHHRMMFEEMRSSGDANGVKDTCCSPAEQLSPFPASLTTQPVAPALNFDQLEAAQKDKLTQQLPGGSCVAWLAVCKDTFVASGGVTILKTVPVPEDPSCETAFLHSIYTLPPMRGQGIASAILELLIQECRTRGITRVQLITSKQGRSVYRKKGFQPLEQVMQLWL